MNIIVAGIHTGIGKTVCSAVLCQALGYEYWKPVQAGDLSESDSIFIKTFVNNPSCYIHPECYQLQTPASPHYAAGLEDIIIKKDDFELPQSQGKILVETAGGVMSPLAENLLNLDLIEQLGLPVILVTNNYLGSINHSLLSYAAIKSRDIPILGLVFVGEHFASSEQLILSYTGLPLLLSIPQFKPLSPQALQEFAQKVHLSL